MSQSTSRRKTEEKILDALRKQLASQGFRGLGVNAVARQAGVSKELIYRYFGGMDGLIRELMGREDYWAMRLARSSDCSDRHGTSTPEGEVADMLLNQLAQLRSRPELQEIRRWELIDLNELTLDIGAAREEASLEFLAELGLSPGRESAARLALLLSGVLYLVLRSKTCPQWFGLDLDSEDGWSRIAEALKSMAPHVLGDCEHHSNDPSDRDDDGRANDATRDSGGGGG